MIPVRVTLT